MSYSHPSSSDYMLTKGDLQRLSELMRFFSRAGLEFDRPGGIYIQFRSKKDYKLALTTLFELWGPGWQSYGPEMIEAGVCEREEFIVANRAPHLDTQCRFLRSDDPKAYEQFKANLRAYVLFDPLLEESHSGKWAAFYGGNLAVIGQDKDTVNRRVMVEGANYVPVIARIGDLNKR